MYRLFLVLFMVFSVAHCFSYPILSLETEKGNEDAREKFGAKMEKKYNLEFLGTSSRYLFDVRPFVFGLSFVDRRDLTIDEGRELIKSLIKDYWEELTTNKIYQDYLTYFCDYLDVGDKVIPEKIGIQVAFWNENVDRPLHPYVARIQVADGKIRYYYADPISQALQEPIVEDLDKIVSLTRLSE